MNDTFKTIEKESTGYFKDKGSKFYAYAFPIADENEVKEHIQKLKKQHHSARHHCYAWRIGTENIRFRAVDDGEPSSTAGKPILGQLQSFEVTNILVVVVRYFGGTLLGVSGLINAYRNATTDVLNNSEIKTRIIENFYELKFTYKELNEVMHIIKTDKLTVVKTQFEENCRLLFSVRRADAEMVYKKFENFYGVNIEPSGN